MIPLLSLHFPGADPEPTWRIIPCCENIRICKRLGRQGEYRYRVTPSFPIITSASSSMMSIGAAASAVAWALLHFYGVRLTQCVKVERLSGGCGGAKTWATVGRCLACLGQSGRGRRRAPHLRSKILGFLEKGPAAEPTFSLGPSRHQRGGECPALKIFRSAGGWSARENTVTG
jgi:hypothetical protein